jgi:hypothetical protein
VERQALLGYRHTQGFEFGNPTSEMETFPADVFNADSLGNELTIEWFIATGKQLA